MKDEKKPTKNSKVEPLHVTREMAEDPVMDHILREGLKRDADKIEQDQKAMNGLPSLDDNPEKKQEIFENIVWELKRKGLWEEEDSADKLSEEDKKALEIGRRVMNEKKKSRKRYALKGVVGAAVVMLGIFSVSMTSDANRLRILSVWNSLVNEELRIDIDNEEDRILDKVPEEDVYSKIENELGIHPIKFLYTPNEMVYDNYDINIEVGNAHLFYKYKDSIVTVYMYKKSDKASRSQNFDGKVVNTIITRVDDIEMKIREVEIPDSENAFAVSFTYEGVYYSVCGQLPREEFEKTMKEIYF